MTIASKSAERILFPGPASEKVGGGAAARRFADAALDLLYPPHCASCAIPLDPGTNTALCRACAARIRWIGSDRCIRCGDGVGRGSGPVEDCTSCRSFPPAYIQQTAALAHYESGPLRDLLLGLKFGRKLHLVRPLATLLAARIRDTELLLPETIVVPAPLTRASLRQRSFNQAGELSYCLALELNLPLEKNLLQKIRATPPQATLKHEQRRVNLKGAFACNERIAARFRERNVLLIDDVITTGSTISECARTLHAAGLGTTRAAAIARG